VTFGSEYNFPDGRNQGWYVDAGYDIQQHLGLKHRTTLNVRYDEYDHSRQDQW